MRPNPLLRGSRSLRRSEGLSHVLSLAVSGRDREWSLSFGGLDANGHGGEQLSDAAGFVHIHG